MTPTKDWNEEEDNFDLTLSQRTEELYRIPNREPDEEGLIEAAVLPLRDLVVFPRMVSPIFVGREGSLLAVQEAQNKEQTVIGLTQHDPDLDTPGPDDFLLIGVEMAVGRLLQMPDGSHSALVQGRRRVEIIEFIRTSPYLMVRARSHHGTAGCGSPDTGAYAVRFGSVRTMCPVGPLDTGRGTLVRVEHLRARLAGRYDRHLAGVECGSQTKPIDVT